MIGIGLSFLSRVPWQVWAGAAVVIGFLLWTWHIERTAYERGRAEETTRIERANRESERRADEAARALANCPPGKWNREAGKCEQ
jgi:hypothetical protein